MTAPRHHFVDVDGHQIFYREAGHRADPTLLLLHGAPSSSHMFRDLIPKLADAYHLIAPDYLGFGLSDAPSVAEFTYTFDALTDIVETVLDRAQVGQYAMYVHDHGAPVGWRLALRHPERVSAIITQNGNAYSQGLGGPFWRALWCYVESPTAASEAPMRDTLTAEALKWRYVHGVPDPKLVNPDAWVHDVHALARPGNVEIQLRLWRDYPSNVDLYPVIQDFFRRSQVPLLAMWGRSDEIFGPAGASAFTHDLPEAEVHVIDGGHFLLESQLDTAAGYIRGFLGRVLRPR